MVKNDVFGLFDPLKTLFDRYTHISPDELGYTGSFTIAGRSLRDRRLQRASPRESDI